MTTANTTATVTAIATTIPTTTVTTSAYRKEPYIDANSLRDALSFDGKATTTEAIYCESFPFP